ncbi:MAG: RNA polymerase sigma factor RpoD/SigA [Candidatus Omnitrophica bacterium]|nr:RNA polymerase sigma factor RpoD/SigA [Candidatus Omnitrophota bacterium]
MAKSRKKAKRVKRRKKKTAPPKKEAKRVGKRAARPLHEKKEIPPPEKSKKSPKAKAQGAEEGEFEGDEITLDKTPMRIYLNQIENIQLLTPEEEISLSKAICLNHSDAKQARERMIRSNLRLVISIARRYSNLGLPFSDLVEEGNIGLMRAVDKFNYKKGYRFSTYASWWIKQAIMRALSNQGKTIRVPVYMFDTISKWRKVRDSLVQQLSRIPTPKEIADAMGVPVEKVKEIERIVSQPGSLNAPVSLDSSAEMMDLIKDESSASPVQNAEDLFEGERVDQLLNYVDERERQVLVLRFGLKGGEPRTLEDTAKQFGVTRERIRQIELAAIKKIRNILKLKEEKLEDYVG